MPTGLLHLLKLQLRGITRRSLRGARSLRRLLAFLLGTLVLGLYLSPNLFFSHRLPPSDPQRVRLAAPFALLGICLLTLVTSAGDCAISFTPGEVDMLFPGPFTRRQLILYKLTKSTAAAIFSAMFFMIVLHHHARIWVSCYVGVFLSLLFIQFFSINTVILAQSLGTQLQSRARRILFIAVVVAGVLVARDVAGGRGIGDPVRLMQRISLSPIGSVLLYPFSFFGQAMTATSPGELLQWAVPAAAMDVALLLLLLAMDANYLEAASAASERRYNRIQRIRSGSLLSMEVSGNARGSLPIPGFFAGVGPIAWRQLTAAVRSSKGLLLLLLILAVGAAPLIYGTHRKGSDFLPSFAGVALWLTLLVSTMLKFDFRGDLDLMDVLKSLPIHPWAITAGQMIAPTLLLAITHLAMLAIAAGLLPEIRVVAVRCAVLVLPFDLLIFAVENLLFLLIPTRPAAASPGDFQIIGRQVFVLAAKAFTFAVIATPPVVIAGVAWTLVGKSWPTFIILLGVLWFAEALAMIPLIAGAFARFDPSIHTPA